MIPIRLLVCGGRDFNDRAAIHKLVDSLPAGSVVIHGDSGKRDRRGRAICGADILTGDAAKVRGLEVRPVRAAWRLYGRSAGPIRNQRMLDEEHPTHYFNFPGGTGTADMVSRCVAAGVPRWRIP